MPAADGGIKPGTVRQWMGSVLIRDFSLGFQNAPENKPGHERETQKGAGRLPKRPTQTVLQKQTQPQQQTERD